MSEPVTVPSLMTMTFIVYEESLARDRHMKTYTHTDRQTHTYTDLGHQN